MVRLVQSADAGKAKVVRLADRWAVWIVVIALSAAAITWLVSGQIIRAVTILVVFCPCALVLATPTAIMAAIGNATKHGFMVREGDALERLAAVDRVALDKTGTLAYGTPHVVAVKAEGGSLGTDDLFFLTAADELNSEHPLGRAIVSSWRERAADGKQPERLPSPAAFSMVPGRGIEATVERTGSSARVIAGNLSLMEDHGLVVPQTLLDKAEEYLTEGCTVTYAAVLPVAHAAGTGAAADNTDEASAATGLRVDASFGFIALFDTPHENAAATISGIRDAGTEPILLTGDNEAAAASIAQDLGIRTYRSGCTPEGKLSWIDETERDGHAVCMVGDGVNDAPALKRAQVGIAMGGIGSDIAVDAADIALVSDDVSELPHLLSLSRRMMLTIKLNMTFSMTLNVVAIVLAITGILNPVMGALVHNAGSVLVISNSALLLGWKRRRRA